MSSTAAIPQGPLVKRNLDLLAHGSENADFLLICGQKHWHVHRRIVEQVSMKMYEKLSLQVDHLQRVYLQPDSQANSIDQLMKFVYTFDYTISSQVSYGYRLQKSQSLASAILANSLGNQYSVPEYAEAGELAFENLKQSLRLQLNMNYPYHDRSDATTRKKLQSDAETTTAVFEGARLIVLHRESLNPCFEDWIIRWLTISVAMMGDSASGVSWKKLDTSLNSLAVKAKLRRSKTSGAWMPPVKK